MKSRLLCRHVLYIVASACDKKEVPAAVQLDAQVISIEPLEATIDFPIYLRGSLNNWKSTVDFMLKSNEQGCLALEADFPKGKTEFKIADADWTRFDVGAKVKTNLTFGEETRLINQFGEAKIVPENLTLTLERDTKLEIKLCQAGLEFPLLSLQKL